MSNFLELIGVLGVLISAIPFFMGIFFVMMPILTRPNKMNFYLWPFCMARFVYKNPQEVEYGASMFFKWGLVFIPSVLFIRQFGDRF